MYKPRGIWASLCLHVDRIKISSRGRDASHSSKSDIILSTLDQEPCSSNKSKIQAVKYHSRDCPWAEGLSKVHYKPWEIKQQPKNLRKNFWQEYLWQDFIAKIRLISEKDWVCPSIKFPLTPVFSVSTHFYLFTIQHWLYAKILL